MDVKHHIDVNDLPFEKKKDGTKYLYKQPAIKPNLGKIKRNVLPKTHVCKVLLYDNTIQRKTLGIQTEFFSRQQRSIQCMYEKSRHAFADSVRLNQLHHDVWDGRYSLMKDAYISEYGTQYMPSAEDAEEYKIFEFAKLAAPINVVCYFLASGNDPRQKAMEQKRRAKKKMQNMTKDPLHEYLKRRGHPVVNLRKDENQTKICSKDQRFKTLTETLIDPGFKSDGYLQISPGYARGIIPPKRRVSGKPRDIELPRFYARLKMKREGSLCSQHSGMDDGASETIYDDDRSSVSSLI